MANPVQFWNDRYTAIGSEYLFGQQPNYFLAAQAPALKAGQRVLCVADGDGRNGLFLAEQGHTVDAFDVSEVGINKAKQFAAARGVAERVNYVQNSSDDFAWPSEAVYDVVVCIFIQFSDPAGRAALWAKIAKCLKPGGLLILQGYGPQQLEYKTGGPQNLALLYTQDLLRDELHEFNIQSSGEEHLVLHEGPHHNGMSHVVSVLAQRK
jgi:SAM-dependent methyltransferase